MVAGAALSDDLTDTQWLVQLEDIGEEDVEGLGKVENMPKMEGRQMVMMIGPAK